MLYNSSIVINFAGTKSCDHYDTGLTPAVLTTIIGTVYMAIPYLMDLHTLLVSDPVVTLVGSNIDFTNSSDCTK